MDDTLLPLTICEAIMGELSKGRAGVDLPDGLGGLVQAEELALFELTVGNLSVKTTLACGIWEDFLGRVGLLGKAFLEASVVDV